MNLGKNRDKAVKKTQEAADRDGRVRWLFEWEGHFWASGIKPGNPAIEFAVQILPTVKPDETLRLL